MTNLRPAGAVPQWTMGDRLAKARTYAHIDQDELGDRIGLSRQTVSNYERNAVVQRTRAVRQWARACGVDEDWVLTGEGTPAPDGGSELCAPRDLNPEPAGYPPLVDLAMAS